MEYNLFTLLLSKATNSAIENLSTMKITVIWIISVTHNIQEKRTQYLMIKLKTKKEFQCLASMSCTRKYIMKTSTQQDTIYH
jgi:hypothetical protein